MGVTGVHKSLVTIDIFTKNKISNSNKAENESYSAVTTITNSSRGVGGKRPRGEVVGCWNEDFVCELQGARTSRY